MTKIQEAFKKYRMSISASPEDLHTWVPDITSVTYKHFEAGWAAAMEKSMTFERVLFFHPESESYVECTTQAMYDLITRDGGEPLDDVTGIEHHEKAFREQNEERVDGEDLLG